ncbi:tim-barrel domain-containing protein [Mortierella sp. GBAus27b]|nr:tim-barrel domain-containing protein [Mortierella sp. GBAus27b]
MSWSGDRFKDMPAVPPTIANPDSVIRASFVPWRYYANVVTFGYSFAFWDWKRWERELDWMFLNGINMALAMTGQEYVFRRMYEDLGLTREELNGFFGGPAYMPWQRMGNLQGSWIVPNDTQYKNDWIDSQWDLQVHIMGRMHEYNITAILPAFHGFVPEPLRQKFPDVKFDRSNDWGYLPAPYANLTFIPSTDSFFSNMTERFFRTQASLYRRHGLEFNTNPNNYYLLDLFNELHPVCVTVECLKQTTSGVMKALKQADPKAIWVMQSWFLVQQNIWQEAETKAFFDGIKEVNEGKNAFVIDLYSDVFPFWNSTKGFYGIDWGWSMLNNFGGGQALYGTLPGLLTEPFKGYQQYPKGMRGMGITMEGINNNEYLYQVVLDIPWESELNQSPLNPQAHLESFIKRRYGPNQTSKAILDVWTTLSQTVWDCPTKQIAQSRSYLDLTPELDMERRYFLTRKFWYNQTKVVRAWGQFVRSASRKVPDHGKLVKGSSFRYDLVDLTREIMAAVVIPGLHAEIVAAYNAKDLARIRSTGKLILKAILDTDRILATHSHFMLGPWIRDARVSAKKGSSSITPINPADHFRYQDYLELSARNQITWWSPKPQQGLADYGGKEWSPVVKEYYYPRWDFFVDQLTTAVRQGRPLDNTTYLEESGKRESRWVKQTTCIDAIANCSSNVTLALEPKGDTVAVAQDIWDRWNHIAAQLAKKADKAANRT